MQKVSAAAFTRRFKIDPTRTQTPVPLFWAIASSQYFLVLMTLCFLISERYLAPARVGFRSVRMTKEIVE